MNCDCDYFLSDSEDLPLHYDNCSLVWEKEHPGKPSPKNNDGSLRLPNKNLLTSDVDFLYHLGLDTVSYDLVSMFGDIKFVCIGGTKHRMREFAEYMRDVLKLASSNQELINLTKHSQRYAMYKVGPVLSVSIGCKIRPVEEYQQTNIQAYGQMKANFARHQKIHFLHPGDIIQHGIGIPSMTTLLQEVIKLLQYAVAKDPVIFRIGTSGGLSIPPGSVVVSQWGLSGKLEKNYELPVLGKVRKLPSTLDSRLSQEVYSLASDSDGFSTYLGGTMAADDFYRGQARLDGPFCDYTVTEKMEFLNKLSQLGVKNIEMEATAFAAFTREAGIRAGIVCVTYLDRLLGDQISVSKETLTEWQTRPMAVVGRYISKCLQRKNMNNGNSH